MTSRQPAPVRAVNRNLRVYSMRSKDQLVNHVMALFAREGSVTEVGADWPKLQRFVEAVGRLYHDNAYHNFHHAVDVANTLAWMLTRPVLSAHLPRNHAFWLLVAAVTHDVDHPGLNNQWEVNVGSERARKYQNVSVLERHSLDLSLELMAQPEMAFHATMAPALRAEGLDLLREVILATDFALHRDFMTAFSAAVKAYPGPAGFGQADFRLLVVKSLMKAADIANTTKPFAQAKVWGLRVMQEFWAQGRLEKQHAFPVGPLNDEERVDLNKAQAGFIQFAAMDLFECLAKLEPALEILVRTLKENVSRYQAFQPAAPPPPAPAVQSPAAQSPTAQSVGAQPPAPSVAKQ